jgi:hypothetical protein
MLFPTGDRGFESISLQRRVMCEPDSSIRAPQGQQRVGSGCRSFRPACARGAMASKSSAGSESSRQNRGFRVKLGCHVFRATGITAYLEAGGTLENAQAMAAHESRSFCRTRSRNLTRSAPRSRTW